MKLTLQRTDLISQITKGNPDSFKDLYEKYKKKVYGTAFLLMKDCDRVEDVVQEVFIQVYKKIKQLKNVDYLDTWIYKITYNCCIKNIIANKKNGASDINLEGISENFLQDKSIFIEDDYIAKEYRNEIISAIYELPPHYYIPIILFYYNDLSVKEIAKIMNCPEGTIKSRLFNSKNILRYKISKIIKS